MQNPLPHVLCPFSLLQLLPLAVSSVAVPMASLTPDFDVPLAVHPVCQVSEGMVVAMAMAMAALAAEVVGCHLTADAEVAVGPAAADIVDLVAAAVATAAVDYKIPVAVDMVAVKVVDVGAVAAEVVVAVA